MLSHGAQSYGLHPCHAASYVPPAPPFFPTERPPCPLGGIGGFRWLRTPFPGKTTANTKCHRIAVVFLTNNKKPLTKCERHTPMPTNMKATLITAHATPSVSMLISRTIETTAQTKPRIYVIYCTASRIPANIPSYSTPAHIVNG